MPTHLRARVAPPQKKGSKQATPPQLCWTSGCARCMLVLMDATLSITSFASKKCATSTITRSAAYFLRMPPTSTVHTYYRCHSFRAAFNCSCAAASFLCLQAPLPQFHDTLDSMASMICTYLELAAWTATLSLATSLSSFTTFLLMSSGSSSWPPQVRWHCHCPDYHLWAFSNPSSPAFLHGDPQRQCPRQPCRAPCFRCFPWPRPYHPPAPLPSSEHGE